MRNISIILAGALEAGLFGGPSPAHASGHDCMDQARTQSQMNACAGRALAEADAELNRIYQAVLKRHADDPVFIARLRAAQRAWIAFRDAELAARYPDADPRVAYGSVYPMCAAQVRATLTRERTAQLRQWLDGMSEGEVCAGSIGFGPGAGSD